MKFGRNTSMKKENERGLKSVHSSSGQICPTKKSKARAASSGDRPSPCPCVAVRPGRAEARSFGAREVTEAGLPAQSRERAGRFCFPRSHTSVPGGRASEAQEVQKERSLSQTQPSAADRAAVCCTPGASPTLAEAGQAAAAASLHPHLTRHRSPSAAATPAA